MKMEKVAAKKVGIPNWLRRYAKRFGLDVAGIVQIWRQNGEGKRVGDRVRPRGPKAHYSR